ncbi:helix-turn-helix domain-containing protein [Nocardia puris]|uniref:helix-turn-helix transcriptional regulator n=1 Tax=Nocardia puris TaxID=208602 RepID=UPI002B4B740B|nr:helix-turn-helix transcriptional regulator [Nocardia puris]MBF6463066.1 helix-turn-helix domain-containing protein [Nocardia puris]
MPRDGFRRDVLEAMFPGRTVSELLRSPDAPAPPAPKNPQEELGALLNHYRTKALVSQEALARECLLDPSYVRHAERGRAIPARRFWAEADIALAAEGALVTAYDQWAEPRNKPREGVRVLARRQLDASSPRMSELLARADASATFKERDLRGPAGARPAGDTPAGGLSRDDAPGERPARRIRTRAR